MEPGGLIGDIADWIEKTTPSRRNRPFAVAAGAAIIGTVLGRTMYGPTRTGTNLYIACLGRSGEGKDWPQKCIPIILGAAGLSAAVGGGEWKSQVALENAIIDQPALCAVIDEIGQTLFGQIMGQKVAAHQSAISATLRKLWAANGTDYTTSASAGRASKIIHAPSLSIFGSSTPDEFFGSLSGDAVRNGFLNRLLLIRGRPGEKTSARRVVADLTVPPSIVERLQALLNAASGDLAGGAVALTRRDAPPHELMAWDDDRTCDAYEAFRDEWEDACREDEDTDGLIGRAAEMAQRLAVIHAASRAGRQARVTMSDWEWGVAVVKQSARHMLREARDRMTESQYHAHAKLVERIIREACLRDSEGIPKSVMIRKVNGRVPPNVMKGILTDLVEAGVIAFVEKKPDGAGRPSQRYVYLGERKEAA